MKRDERLTVRPRAAAASQVSDAFARVVNDRPACPLEPEAEIGIFPVQKKTLVETSNRFERLAADHHARAGHPIDVDRGSALVWRDEVTPRPRVLWPRARQPARPSREERGEAGEPPGRRLNRSVGVHHQRSNGADVRVMIEPFGELLGGAPVQDSIGVQEEEVLPEREACGAIDARTESGVCINPDQLHPRKLLDQTRCCLGHSCVVNDNNLEISFNVVLQRVQTGRQLAVRAEIDDESGDQNAVL